MKDLRKMSPKAICEEVVADQNLKIQIADNMKQYGGSFVKALSGCIILADRNNLYKLCDTFLDYILEYEPSKMKNNLKKIKNGREKLLELFIKTGEFTSLELAKIAIAPGENRNKAKELSHCKTCGRKLIMDWHSLSCPKHGLLRER